VRRIELVRAHDVNKAQPERAKGLAGDDELMRPAAGGMPAEQQREAARRLARLGVPIPYAAMVFIGLRLLSVAAIGVLALSVTSRLTMFSGSRMMPVLMAAILAAVGWYVPVLILDRLVKRRAKAAAAGLPDALELLVVCVEAGLSLEDGIDRIIGELERSQPALAAELALTSADLKILPSRDQALANLAARVDVPSVRSVVSTLTQTLRYGTPLAQAMRVVAAEMRTAALINLEERASRLPAIMTVPMMLFIMPVIFLIVGGPAVLRLIDILHHR